MAHALFWVMQDLYHQPYGPCTLNRFQAETKTVAKASAAFSEYLEGRRTW